VSPVPRPRGRADGEGRGPLLALRLLAPLHLGQLAAAGGPELFPVRGRPVLVAQPPEHRLRGLRRANNRPLEATQKGAENMRDRAKNRFTGGVAAIKTAHPGGDFVASMHTAHGLHNRYKSLFG
jgi:hypothetical protein